MAEFTLEMKDKLSAAAGQMRDELVDLKTTLVGVGAAEESTAQASKKAAAAGDKVAASVARQRDENGRYIASQKQSAQATDKVTDATDDSSAAIGRQRDEFGRFIKGATKAKGATEGLTKAQIAQAKAAAKAANAQKGWKARLVASAKSALKGADAYLKQQFSLKNLGDKAKGTAKSMLSAENAMGAVALGATAAVAAIGALAVGVGALTVAFSKGVMTGSSFAKTTEAMFAARAGGDPAAGKRALEDIMQAADMAAAPIDEIRKSYGSLISAGMDNQMAKDFAAMRQDWLAINPDEAEAAWGKLTDNLAEGLVTASQFEDLAKVLGGADVFGKALGIDPAILNMKNAEERAEKLDAALKGMDPDQFLQIAHATHKAKMGIGEVSKASKTAGERWESFKERLFVRIGAGVDFGLGTVMDQLDDWMESKAGQEFISDMQAIFKSAIEIAQVFGEGLFGELDSSTIKDFTTGIKEYLADPAIKEAAAALGKTVGTAAIAIVDLYLTALPYVKQFASAFATVAPVVVKVIDVMAPILKGTIGIALAPLIGLVKMVSHTFAGLGKVASGVWDLLHGKAEGFKSIISGFGEFIQAALSPLTTMIDAIGYAFGATASVSDTAANWIKEAWGGITDYLGSLWETIAGFSLTDAGWQIASSLVAGISEGIANGVSSAVNAVVNLASSVKSAAKNALGIASPSAVFADLGKFVPEGMAQGMAANDNAQSAAKDMARGVQSTVVQELGIRSPSAEMAELATAAAPALMGEAALSSAAPIMAAMPAPSAAAAPVIQAAAGVGAGTTVIFEPGSIVVNGSADADTLDELERRLRDVFAHSAA